MGLIYRCLFTGKNTLAVPAIYLLETIAKFRRGVLTNNLYSQFDLTAKAIPRILSLKGDVTAPIVQRRLLREKLIRFFLEFISNSSVIVRKDIIAQKNIVSGWFRYMDEDSAELIRDTLQVFDQKVIHDNSFNKPLRMNLFNDWVMSHLANLLSREDIPENSETTIGKQVYDFLVFLVTDVTNGLKHNDKQWYLPDSDMTNDNDKVNNTILFSFLKVLKPWDSIQKQNLALEILSTSPELVGPYFSEEWNISLDPKITMFWISSMLFFSRVIQLPVPSPLLNSFSAYPPSTKMMFEHIFPSPISKAVLTKSLLSPSPLIKYNALQSIILAFKKLETIIDIYKAKNWSDGYYDILEEMGNRLPEINTIVNSVISMEGDSIENYELLKNTIIRTIGYYANLLPELFNKTKFVLPKQLMSSLEKDNLTGFELIDLQNILEIQTRLGGVSKWWNKSGDLPYSLFTVLLRTATTLQKDLFTSQIETLVQYLCKPTLIFQQNHNELSPISVLINSLISSIPYMKDAEKDKVWKLLDESISRCQRTPYKYIDTIAAYQKKANIQNANVSLFVVVIIEQWKFVDKKSEYKNAENWILRYLRNSCVAGSDPNAIKMLLESTDLCEIFEKEVSYLNKPFDKIATLWNKRFSAHTTFDVFLSSMDIEELNGKIISSQLDLFAAKFRLKHDENIEVQSLLLNKMTSQLSSNLHKMLLTKEVFVDILLHPRLWKSFFKQLKLWNSDFSEVESKDLKDFIKSILTSDTLSSKKRSLLQSSSFLLERDFLKNQIQVLPSNSLDKDTASYLELVYVVYIQKSDNTCQLDQDEISKILDYAKSIESSKIFVALRQYIEAHSTKFTTTSQLLHQVHKFCKDPVFSSTRLLQVIIRALPPSELPSLHIFTDSNLVDDLTFLSVLSEISFNSEKDDKMAKIFEHAVSISLDALTDETGESNAVLLETSIEFLSKVVGQQALPISNISSLEKIVKFVALYTGPQTVSSNMITLVGKIAAKLTLSSKISEGQERLMRPLRIWGQRIVTWIAKRFAEDDDLGVLTLSSIKAFYQVINDEKLNIWLLVPATSLNTMFEIALNRYIDRPEVVQFVAAAIPTSRIPSTAYSTVPSFLANKKHIPVEFTKLLQIVLNHERAVASMELSASSKSACGTGLAISYIVFTLFNIDVTRHSTPDIQGHVLALCMGTQRPQDLLLIGVLHKIESRLSSSFCDMVYSWEITTSSPLSMEFASGNEMETGALETKKKRKINELSGMLFGKNGDDGLNGATPLFSLGKSGIEVTFDSGLIHNTIKNFDYSVKFEPVISNNKPSSKVNKSESYEQFLERAKQYTNLLRSDLTYDIEFFLLLVTSSNLLEQKESSLFVENLRAFVDSGVFSLVLCSLSHTNIHIHKLAFSLLIATFNGTAESLPSSTGYPDSELLRVVCNRIFAFVTESRAKREKEELVAQVKGEKINQEYPLFPSYLAVPLAIVFTTIVPQPEHLLYDKIIQGFVFNAPSFGQNEIPLLTAISKATTTAEHHGDSLLREFIWFIDTVTASLVDIDALEIYIKRGLFEWVLNIANTLPIPSNAISANKESDNRQRDSEAIHAIHSSKMYLRAYNNLVHVKLVRLIKRAQEIKEGSMLLETRNGFLAWVQNAVAINGSSLSPASLSTVGSTHSLNKGQKGKAVDGSRESEDYVLSLEKLGIREWVTMPKNKRYEWTLSREIPLKY